MRLSLIAFAAALSLAMAIPCFAAAPATSSQARRHAYFQVFYRHNRNDVWRYQGVYRSRNQAASVARELRRFGLQAQVRSQP